jgi:glycosyltransferase involved in cell wall biosynthesis
VVEDGHNGLLVPVRDARALSVALTTLGEDRPRRLAMGRASAARARVHFDERRVVEIVMETYRAVAARKQLPLRGCSTT